MNATLDMTVEESESLDEWAATFRRGPLQRDEQLYEAFADDRKQHPYRSKRGEAVAAYYTARRLALDPETFPICSNEDCGKRMRPKSSLSSEFPGTVQKGARGLCSSCHTTDMRRRRTVEADRG